MENQNNFKKFYPGLMVINLFCISLFLFILRSFQKEGIFYEFDIFINSMMATIQTPTANFVFNAITQIGSPGILSLIAIIVSIILALNKKWYYFILMIIGMTGGQIIKSVLKNLIERPRPENTIIEVSSYSFPSGHAVISLIFFTLLAYSFRNKIKNKKTRYAFIFLSGLSFLLIGSSRIYLNAHWISDVLAGFILGIFWITLLILILKITIILIGTERLDKMKKALENHLSYLKS